MYLGHLRTFQKWCHDAKETELGRFSELGSRAWQTRVEPVRNSRAHEVDKESKTTSKPIRRVTSSVLAPSSKFHAPRKCQSQD